MELIRGQYNLQPRHRGCVATIGNFDGVHLGHQAVLGQLAEKAAEMQLPSVAIIFEPYPREYFAGDKAPARLTRFREKLQVLRRFSVDRVFCLRFDNRLANTPAEAFIERLLIDGLGIKYLVVGDDFRFGKDRRGNFALLQQAGVLHGFQVVNMHSFVIDGQRVSSTLIREALQQGNMNTAEKYLGRPFRMSGKVMHGDKRGRSIGFPTANLRVSRQVSPVRGVFAVEVFGLDQEPLRGVANVGRRPTVNGTQNRLEVHLFDFDATIYSRHLHVDLLHRIRDEMKFDSLDALTQQIGCDVKEAKAFFANK